MSVLRHRKKDDLSTKTPLTISSPSDASNKRRELHARQRMPSPTTGTPRVLLVLLLGSAAVLFAFLYQDNKFILGGKTKGLPPYYALCSSEGRIYTANPSLPSAECVVVEDKRVLFVGGLKEVRKSYGDVDTLGSIKQRKGKALKIKHLKKRWSVTPGLIDAHAHPLEYGEAQTSVDLVGSTSVNEIIDRIVKHIESRPDLLHNPDKFVQGLGWDQTLFESKAFPTAADIDRHPLLSARPIVLARIDVHAYWVSSRVLERLGALPEEVSGGEIIRGGDGSATGVFLDKAMLLITQVMPPWTDADRLSFLRTTSQDMLAHGMTSVHDAAATPATIDFYKNLDKQSLMPVRMYAMVDCGDQFCGDRVERYEGDRVISRSIKLFSDGALGSWGAAMWEPYSDNSATTGILRSPESSFLPLIKKWIAQNFQVNAHAIGDRANTIILDAFEHVIAQEWGGVNKGRLRIEHAQILRQADIERMGRLGIVGSVQPTHATSDMGYAESRLGPERIKGAYAWQTMISHNIPLCLGSDFPVSPLSPYEGLHASLYRTTPSKPHTSPHGPNGWYRNESLSPQQALEGFTRNAAWCAGMENEVGSLEVGKKADLVVLEGDWVAGERGPMDVRVRATVVDGQVVFGRV